MRAYLYLWLKKIPLRVNRFYIEFVNKNLSLLLNLFVFQSSDSIPKRSQTWFFNQKDKTDYMLECFVITLITMEEKMLYYFKSTDQNA